MRTSTTRGKLMRLYQYCLVIFLGWICVSQIACAPQHQAAFKDCEECPEMINIPAGRFLMGSDPFTNLGSDQEKPQHPVEIQAFAMGKYEITQEQWYAVMGNNPSENKGRKLPITNISWNESVLFAEKLSQKTGKNYRLPSEAEWEYAARAGTTTIYFWGNKNQANDYAWHESNSEGNLHPVGQKKPNQFGLYDMVGNVYEWTQDCSNGNYNGAPIDQRPWLTGDCSLRVVRSGAWGSPFEALTSAMRYSLDSSSARNSDIGLRVVRAP
jgi:formylglycine-generating enzyme required for sulfatase activity